MGIIKPWNSIYPVAVDDLVTNFPVLIDGVDTVIADHSNELAKAVVALETEQQTIVTTLATLGNITLQYNTVSQTASLRTLNFTGTGVVVTTSGTDTTVTINKSSPNTIYFAPGSPTPGPGVLTTWAQVNAAMATVRSEYPGSFITVDVDASAVGYFVDVPAGTYSWHTTKFISMYAVFNFKTGASVTSFNNVEFMGITLTTDATSGTPAFVAYGPGLSTNVITLRKASGVVDNGPGFIPVVQSAAGVGGIYFVLLAGAGMLQSGPSSSAAVDANGGLLYFHMEDNTYIESRCVSSTTGTPTATVIYASPSADASGASVFATSHPLYTSGTVVINRLSAASRTAFTPNGDIAATTVQDAIVEVRNDTDTKLAATRFSKLGAGGSYLSTIQTVTTATATISADVDWVVVTYSGGTCALTFGDSTGFPVGRACIVQKANTSSFGITVVSDGATSINGGVAGAAMTLPSSTTASSTTTTDMTYLVQRIDSTNIRVS